MILLLLDCCRDLEFGGYMCSYVLFKQKTAYEMRISDWSSDVCSSDLPRPWNSHRSWRDAAAFSGQQPPDRRCGRESCRANRRDRAAANAACRAAGTADRKSVVSGESVSVRVDRGG